MRWVCVIALFGLAVAAPADALADGGPVEAVQGGPGIAVPGIPFRYIALAGGGHTTLLRRTGPAGASAGSAIRVDGTYGIPAVAYGGQTTGLTADGRTLVLAEIPASVPPRTTRLLVLDVPRLTVRARIVLPGWSIVDAISPDGRWLYLIHYPSADLSRYEVLAYNLVTRHLLAKPIVDPHDDDDRNAMTGLPVTRVMSPDSRWAYTLYIRPSGAPFIHALDTVGVRAVCVDLPAALANADLGNASLRLGAGGTMIRVTADGITQALVNARTFAVTPVALTPAAEMTFVPGQVAPDRAAIQPVVHKQDTHGSGDLPWVLLVAAALAAAGGAIGLRSRLRIE